MRSIIHSGILPPLLLGFLVVTLGVSVVIRANTMRETELMAERLLAVRDSLSVSNLEHQLTLATLCSPPRVVDQLSDQGFSMPTSPDIRFVLYDSDVPWTGGALTRRLAYLLPLQWRSTAPREVKRNEVRPSDHRGTDRSNAEP